MPNSNPQKTPLNISDTFAQAFLELGRNEASMRLRRSIKAQEAVTQALKGMGQTRFISMTHQYDEGRVALVLYAGDGIVVKIIPTAYLGHTKAVYHLPAITTLTVDTGPEKYAIKTYPWIMRRVSERAIGTLRKKITEMNLKYTKGDGTTRNIRRMPDAKQTLVGIDSNMFDKIDRSQTIPADIDNAWHEYIHRLFPIYNEAAIPEQTEETTFDFISIHDPNTNIIGFDHRSDPPIMLKTEEPEPEQPKSFWDRIGLHF